MNGLASSRRTAAEHRRPPGCLGEEGRGGGAADQTVHLLSLVQMGGGAEGRGPFAFHIAETFPFNASCPLSSRCGGLPNGLAKQANEARRQALCARSATAATVAPSPTGFPGRSLSLSSGTHLPLLLPLAGTLIVQFYVQVSLSMWSQQNLPCSKPMKIHFSPF